MITKQLNWWYENSSYISPGVLSLTHVSVYISQALKQTISFVDQFLVTNILSLSQPETNESISIYVCMFMYMLFLLLR